MSLSVFKRKAEGRAGRTAKLGASLALGMGVLAGFGSALVVGTSVASAGTASNVPLSCNAPVVGPVTGVTATVSETPDLPSSDQWGTAYPVTPSVTVNIPGALIALAQQFSQPALEVDTVTPQLVSSGFTQDPGQSPASNNTQTITVDSTTLANGATASSRTTRSAGRPRRVRLRRTPSR